MTRPAKLTIAILVTAALASCGREGTPTGPSGQTSFLTGTWRGTVTIQVNPGDPNPPAPMSGDMTWTFEVVPQTNMQSLRATIRSMHPWLTMETTGSTAVSPSNSPPTQISTHGEFNSPRGCRGTFGSVGTAEATRIEADFTGTDCQLATFSGRMVLTKQ
jgi:hypothetical protein